MKIATLVNNNKFKRLEDFGNNLHEVMMGKSRLNHHIPKHIGFFVLCNAKLKMLQFYYDFLDVFIDCSDFELGHMDTDSLYFAISNSAGEFINEEHERNKAKQPTNLSTHILNNIIKPSKRQDFHNMLFNHFCDDWDSSTFFFPHQCCKAHHVYDQTPGLFKLEGRGHMS